MSSGLFEVYLKASFDLPKFDKLHFINIIVNISFIHKSLGPIFII